VTTSLPVPRPSWVGTVHTLAPSSVEGGRIFWWESVSATDFQKQETVPTFVSGSCAFGENNLCLFSAMKLFHWIRKVDWVSYMLSFGEHFDFFCRSPFHASDSRARSQCPQARAQPAVGTLGSSIVSFGVGAARVIRKLQRSVRSLWEKSPKFRGKGRARHDKQ
jgi:hypothetical protein